MAYSRDPQPLARSNLGNFTKGHSRTLSVNSAEWLRKGPSLSSFGSPGIAQGGLQTIPCRPESDFSKTTPAEKARRAIERRERILDGPSP